MGPYGCPVCSAIMRDTVLRDVASLGPYTITLTCGATFYVGRPDPESELHCAWWNFDDHDY